MHVVERALTVVVAVDATAVIRVIEQKASIERCLPGWLLSVEVLVFRLGSVPLSKSFEQPGLHVFHREQGELPIVYARNICQQHLHDLLRKRGGLGLVLDDDLLWTLPETGFEALLAQLASLDCGMALLGVTGDPPVPREYLRAAPLLDFLFHRAVCQPTGPVLEYLAPIETDAVAPEEAHHDLYAFTHLGFVPFSFDTDMRDFFCRLYHGKTTTRRVTVTREVVEDPLARRGGATLILDPQVLAVPNKSVVLDDWVSRRSDMVMAITVAKCGYKIFQTPSALRHNRQPSFDSDSTAKLVTDVLGSAYVEHIRGVGPTADLAIYRSQKTRAIIVEATRMLTICRELVAVSSYEKKYIDKIILGNGCALEALEHLEYRISAQPIRQSVSIPADSWAACR